MGHFSSFVVFIPVVAYLLTGTFGTRYPAIVYVDDYCNRHDPVLVTTDVRIKLSRSKYLDPNRTCTVILSTTSGNKIVARFLDYQMNIHYVNEYGNCQVESIQLYNSSEKPQLTPSSKGYCCAHRPGTQYYLNVRGSFNFITYQNSSIKTAAVDLLVTKVIDKRYAPGSKCPTDYFDCYYNNYCVSHAVTCNGFNDCGNNRDEIDGCGLAFAVIAGVAAGIVVFVVVAIIGTVLLVRCRRRNVYELIN